jgi:uncharacterized protein
MQFERKDADEKFLVRGYSDTTFRVAGKEQAGAVLVAADYAEPSPCDHFDALDATSVLEAMKEVGPVDVLLIGTGKTMKLLTPANRQAFEAGGLAVDVMDSGAAARTYNVLVMEDRQVACLLFPAGS